MNNRDLYRNTFSRVHASGKMTMEDIMNRKKKTPRASRRLVAVFAMAILILAMGITVNAATGGEISHYFGDLLGTDQKMQITRGDQEPLDIFMKDLDIGIYDGDQNLVQDLNMADADDIDFDTNSQTCRIDGKEYQTVLLVDVDEGGTIHNAHGQLRLYAPEDYAKAMETLVVPDDMYCIHCIM